MGRGLVFLQLTWYHSYIWGRDMCDERGDTGAFLKVLDGRYEHLDSTWLKTFLTELNESVGRLKQGFQGNAIMQILWRGGKPGKIDWLVKVKNKPQR